MADNSLLRGLVKSPIISGLVKTDNRNFGRNRITAMYSLNEGKLIEQA
jgi:hypothetical protein